MPKLIDLQKKSRAIELYESGHSLVDAASMTGLAVATTYNVLKRAGVNIRGNFMPKEKEHEIKRLWEAGHYRGDIATMTGVYGAAVRRALKRQGIGDSKPGCKRKYSVKDNAFSELNPSSRYWIGFILADGNLFIKKNQSGHIQFTIKESDKSHLEKLGEFLEYDRPLRYRWVKQLSHGGYSPTKEYRGYFTQRIPSNEICRDLQKYFITPNKSLTATVHPDLVFDKDFWRGVIDGDGCLTYSKLETTAHLVVTLVGAKHVCESFKLFAESIGVKGIRKVYPRKNIYMIGYSRSDAYLIAKTLYENSPVALDRKKELAEYFMRFPCGNVPISEVGHRIPRRKPA